MLLGERQSRLGSSGGAFGAGAGGAGGGGCGCGCDCGGWGGSGARPCSTTLGDDELQLRPPASSDGSARLSN